ncbi:15-hydroxyprostaglandin dehydrogenase [Plasmopara halstedii]|uniref:15-hydroxyprostaglandin dehydrogenase n=1 Tax=Plasmopara halstedii TaxID=4781 RepID=A0A0P1AFJ8_PLAHL|nr:15-hydroxyprostaglandin dehydrogenase [Plasmopara halstedii]CEG39495.1 15-hydroxyprostaglandin dehydrogenase [Plasmopara halstedii]|eukprot:XP_024575864.1 15-hydroxyprostaglandin dehydrogenase [Plasmopara halstedii]
MEFRKVVAIVTGGGRGFGRAFAEEILACHGKVMITDINLYELEATGKELRRKHGEKNVCWDCQDVTAKDSFPRAFEYASNHFRTPVNVLVNNAGIAGDLTFYDSKSTTWENVINIDLTALIRGTQFAIGEFKRTLNGEEGVIVNLSSMASLFPVPFSPVYAAAKAGVTGFTRSLYQLKKSDNIRCFGMCPAFAETEMGRSADKDAPEYTKMMGGLLPVKVVVDAFAAGMRESDNAGRMLRITSKGTVYNRFPGDQTLFPNSKL